MALFGRFFGRAAAEGAGFAFGRASAPVLSPALEELRQEAWKVYATRIPDVAALAAGVAQEKINEPGAREWAQRHGFGRDSFNALVEIALTAPDVGMAMQAWRRGKLTPKQFEKVLRRHGIAKEWDDAIEALKLEVLPPVVLAQALHRGLIKDPGLMPVPPPTKEGNIKAYPVYDIPALAEAAASGYDHDHLGVLVGLAGNPMGPHEAAQSVFRKILLPEDFERAIAEGNTRNEWGAAIFEHAKQIPTARDFIENYLRGYRTFEEAAAGAALHGMSREDARLIFQNAGRPLNLHQISQALAWGGKYDPQPGDDRDPYKNAVLIGAVTPAYYDLQEHLKYIVPGFFALRTLQEKGVLKEAEAATWYKRLGWVPDLAEKVAAAFAVPATTAAKENPYVAKADNQLWTALHKAYVKMGAPRAEVEPLLAHLIAAPAVRDEVFTDWDLERQAQALAAPAA